jgi:hypothetical protein
MTVRHKLARLIAGRCQIHAIHNVVKSQFEELQQIFARNTMPSLSLGQRVPKRFFKDSVNALHLLLLAKLSCVLRGLLLWTLSVLPGREVSAVYRALSRIAPSTLQKELHPLAPALPTSGIVVNGHLLVLLSLS